MESCETIANSLPSTYMQRPVIFWELRCWFAVYAKLEYRSNNEVIACSLNDDLEKHVLRVRKKSIGRWELRDC